MTEQTYSTRVSQAALQLPLFGRETPEVDPSFPTLRRLELAPSAFGAEDEPAPYVDYAPGWLLGHAQLFDELARAAQWRHESRWMYEREVMVPRLVAWLPQDWRTESPTPRVLLQMHRALSLRYGELGRIGLALYRDGRDSVAWHSDRELRDLSDSIVAIVTLGGPRRFLLRPCQDGAGDPRVPRKARTSIAFTVGWGDLLVMGGSCQLHYEHCVPKTRKAEPRMAVMFRRGEDATPSG
jgi:alkylated DNA repair dioxygenase AlkB